MCQFTLRFYIADKYIADEDSTSQNTSSLINLFLLEDNKSYHLFDFNIYICSLLTYNLFIFLYKFIYYIFIE